MSFIERNMSTKNLRFIQSCKNAFFMFLTIVIMVVGSNTIVAQPYKNMPQAKVSADSILIGDQVELTIVAKLKNNQLIHFPFFTDSIVYGIEILGAPSIDTVKVGKDSIKLNYRQTITSFDEGFYRIPPFELILFQGENNPSDTLYTRPIWFLVNTLPPDSTVATIYDIKGPLAEPVTFSEVAPWVGSGLLFIGLVVLVIYLVRRWRDNKPIFFAPKPKEPPHVVALRQLNEILEKQLWVTDNHKHYYSLLTDTIRQYIEGRFHVFAMEQTTHEIISELKTKDLLDKNLMEPLQELFELADLVKFARHTSLVSENEASLNFGFKFVNQTKEDEEEIEDTKSNAIPITSSEPSQSISIANVESQKMEE